MPARPRLAAETFDAALDVAQRYPDDQEVQGLVRMVGDLFYANELSLAFLNRGISGKQARHLFREYERFIDQQGATT